MKPLFAILTANLSLLAQVVTGPPGRQQNQTGKASITGKVVDAVTHAPIRKAIVTLNGPANLSVATDAEGHFAFRELAAGSYFVQAQHDQYPTGLGAFNTTWRAGLSLRPEEDKGGVELSLMPGGTLHGRVVDEEGYPLAQCQVNAMQFRDGGIRGADFSPGGQSDDKGEYRVENLPAGKYYVTAQCQQAVPRPHAFLRREEVGNAPALIYPIRFYPAAEQPAGAGRVTVTPGASMTGIDFQMVPASGVAVRGRLLGRVARRQLLVGLLPRDSQFARFRQWQSTANPNTGEFSIPNVPRGSYELTVTGLGEDCECYARVPMEVGETFVEPVDVSVLPKPRISGTVTVDGDSQERVSNLRVSLIPRVISFDGRQPQGRAAADGSFALNAPPGRWRLQVSGAPGYIKSVTLGDQPVSPANLETGPEPGSLKIVMGTKYAQIDVAVTGLSSDAGRAAGILWTAGEDAEVRQGFGASPQGRATLNIPPGSYYACAFDTPETGPLFQDRALLKALESRCTKIEAGEGEHPSVTVPLIAADDLKRLQDSLDSGDSAAPQ